MRNRAEIKVTLYLLRHGATPANREHRYLGKTDEALSEEGRAELLLKKKEIPAKLLLVSPMLRCRQTAEILFPGRAQMQIPEWTEMDFGRFEGKNYRELNGDPDYQAWIDSGGTLSFPGGESREAFIRRTNLGFARALSYLRAENTMGNTVEQMRKIAETDTGYLMEDSMKIRAAAVVHGGTIMALCSSFSDGAYFDFQVKNGEGYACRFKLPAEQVDDLEFIRKNGMEIRKL